ncbi:hypothetical protein QBC33DRAFT_548650 [Phialemonium atrogriseum]|uniref:Uncharacterized protein n=1 Tax=Phialemonium atrogriseum TaxID=1093897 RepID=A0AAJ0BVI7_9PEZI|nr:uncharacterized protein QBC33DRAFT_548650 [Phialemonium atrogriseum]KAK1763807.1 hypothetical protein QBC33DRAFT_548650 [Phialemonium atrogriseum]
MSKTCARPPSMGKKDISKKPPPASLPGSPSLPRATTSAVSADPTLGYKLRVLIHDFRQVASNHTSQHRISNTTDPLYISGPYFTPKEAAAVKGAIVDTVTRVADKDGINLVKFNPGQTAESAIQSAMANFFDKRRASGDARPCGPHDMAPIYEAIFGIEGGETDEERFLGRLRRSGLGNGETEGRIPTEAPNGGGGGEKSSTRSSNGKQKQKQKKKQKN